METGLQKKLTMMTFYNLNFEQLEIQIIFKVVHRSDIRKYSTWIRMEYGLASI